MLKEQDTLQDKRLLNQMREMSIQMEKLEREYSELLDGVGLTHEEMSDYIDNPENFSQPIWERLQNEKKKLNEKHDLNMKNITDPTKVKKAYSERSIVQPHWMFVR